MQKTNFKFEAIVHDDVSTDNSVAIIREYAEKYPNIIKPIYEKENQYSKKDGSLERIMNKACQSKYIAMCEGDDYWIDSLKLQKQVDFLEAHPEYVYSCHRYRLYDENTKMNILFPNIFFDKEKNELNFTFDVEYPFKCDWVTKTLTCVFRKDALDISTFDKFKYYRDTHIVYYILLKGFGICHSFVGGVYRKNSTSVFGSQSLRNQCKISYKVYEEFYRVTRNPIFEKILKKAYLNLLLVGHQFVVPHNVQELQVILFRIPFLVMKKCFTYSLSFFQKNASS